MFTIALIFISIPVLNGCSGPAGSTPGTVSSTSAAASSDSKPAEVAQPYWFVSTQKDSLKGDMDWWESSRSAEYENFSGHPTLAAICRNSRFVQGQLNTDGVFLESRDDIVTVPSKVDGKHTVYYWPISKDYQSLILSKAQFTELLRHKDIILGLPDYHGHRYNLVLEIPPVTKEFTKSCGLNLPTQRASK